MKEPKVLMMASVASMIDLFNKDNIDILLGLGYEVHVAANFEFGSITSKERVNAYKEELEHQGIKVFHIPVPRSLFQIKNIFSSFRMMKKIVQDNHYDIVHCHSPIGGVVARLACAKFRKSGTKVIYTAHGFHFFKGASKKAWLLFYPVELICSMFTDVLITINQEDYCRAKKLKANKCEYVPGIGVHTSEFQNVKIDKRKRRAELGIELDDFVFMSTGQISIRKNQEVIIRALAKITNQKVKYLIVGFGELEDKLKNLAKELHIEDRVIFAGYRSDVKELLHVADAFAFPSLQEGLPVALMEAMSVGMPVVCSRIRGNTDLIEDGKGGYMYECHDVEGFAEGMKKIINCIDSSEMNGVNIKTMQNFEQSLVNEKMKEIYLRIKG